MSMTNGFSSDAPLSKLRADNKPIADLDRFGRVDFLRGIARLIRQSVSDTEGLVVSLEGPWGSGKTSAKNMLSEMLTEEWAGSARILRESKSTSAYSSLITVEFDPWMFSDASDVVSLLFSAIRDAIDEQSGGWAAEEKADKRKRAEQISGAAKAVEIAANVDRTGILKAISQSLKWVSDAIKPVDNATKPLRQAREELIRQLRLLPEGDAIVVFIDEIDRLDDCDIAALFKCLKSVGDLPRVVYVPVFDREIVGNALNRVSQAGRGQQYLEKIVQVPVRLPEIPEELLWKDLLDQVNAISGSSEFGTVSQQDNYFLQGGQLEVCVKPFIHTLRDVNRIVNAFRELTGLLYNEVNLAELLCIVCIELFDQRFYEWIYWHRGELLDNSSKKRQDLENKLEHITEALSEVSIRGTKPSPEECDRRMGMLEVLFPAIDAAQYGNSSIDSNRDPETRRISVSKSFPSYFQAGIGNNISRQVAIDFLKMNELTDKNSDVAFRNETVDLISKLSKNLSEDRLKRLLGYYELSYPQCLAVEEDDENWPSFPEKERNIQKAVCALLSLLPPQQTCDFFACEGALPINRLLLRVRILQSAQPEAGNALSFYGAGSTIFLRNGLADAYAERDKIIQRFVHCVDEWFEEDVDLFELSQYAIIDLLSFWKYVSKEKCDQYLKTAASLSEEQAIKVAALFATSSGLDSQWILDTSVKNYIPEKYLDSCVFSKVQFSEMREHVTRRYLKKMVVVASCIEQKTILKDGIVSVDPEIVEQWLSDIEKLASASDRMTETTGVTDE